MTLKLIPVSDSFSVSTQVTLGDIPTLVEAGVKSLICNRPDGEANDQPTITEIRAAAEAAGIKIAYIPVVSGKLSAADVKDFSTAVDRMESPVHAFCRTGTRSITLWSLYQRNQGVADSELLERARACGYDLS
ncbi:MAG: TIGR01244 family sulfur transferase, partial [Congregibacter sp.]|nr:TIGR01244 family sulfur transferase [Congregibacter sp.]